MKLPNQNGITPLTEEELAELIPPTIFTREHLNQWEQIFSLDRFSMGTLFSRTYLF
jgi:hypothetical protein